MTPQFCHVELRVRDLGASIELYREAFAWTIVPMSPTYVLMDPGVAPMIGITVADRMPVGVGNYCRVDDVDAMVRRTTELGGRVLIRGDAGGAFAGTLDPWGNELFFWQRDSLPAHHGRRANPIVFVEMSVPDLVTAQNYYQKLCGWSFWSPVSTSGGFAVAEGCGLPLGVGVCISTAKGATTFIEVPDLPAMLDHLSMRQIHISPIAAFPDGGRYALFLDRDGNRIGLFEPARH